ncbi:MAG TPA: hypothetical protein VGH19_19300 [Verrucomicrobiae bacterium]
MEATGGSITLSVTSNVTGGSGNIRLYGQVDVVLGGLVSTTGDVSVIANTGSIIDGDNDGNTGSVDISGDDLRLQADIGIGAADNAVETTVNVVTAHAGANGIFLYETNAVTVGTVAVAVNRVLNTGLVSPTPVPATPDTQAGLVTTGGPVVLSNGTGTMTIDTAVTADGSGNVLLNAAAGSLTVNADINSTTGHITIIAAQSLTLNAGVDIATASTGTVSLRADSGSLTMAGNSTVVATDSATRLYASADVVLGNVTAADVAVIANTGSITNATGTTKNVTATNLLMTAGRNVGVALRHITTNVTNLTVNATGNTTAGMFVTEDNDVTVKDVSVTVTEIDVTNTPTVRAADVLSDLTTGNNGDVILVSTAGGITLADGADTDGLAISANGSGKILVSAGAGNVTVQSDVKSGTGDISLVASLGVALETGVDVTTATAGTVLLGAGINGDAASVTMHGTANVVATGSSVRIYASTDVVLGNVTADNVSIVADTGSVTNAAGTTKNVTATNLRIDADDAVGVAARHITTAVTNLTVVAEGNDLTTQGVYISEDNAVTVTGVTVTVQAVTATAGLTPVVDNVQSDVTANSNGNIVLIAGNTMTLTDGSDADGYSVHATGLGNILLWTSAGDVVLNALGDVRSAGGNISIHATNGVSLAATADIFAPAGTIDILTVSGSIAMASNSQISTVTGNGDIRLQSGASILLGGVNAGMGGGDVSLVATDSITDNGDTYVNVIAGRLRMEAGNAIGAMGASDNDIDVTVDVLAARSGAGGMNIEETDAVTIGTVAVIVHRVDDKGVTADVSDTVVNLSDLATMNSSNGTIALQTVNGAITVTEGTAPAGGIGVSANGSGNVLLYAKGALGSITLEANADVVSGTGHISVIATQSISLIAGADIITTGAGTVDIEAAAGSITSSTTSNVTAGSGNVRLFANVNVVLGGVISTSGNVSVTANTGSITDADSDGTVDVTALSLSLLAEDGIGESNNSIETNVTTLTARNTMTAGIFLRESNGLVIDDVAVTVNRVTTTAALGTAADAVQSDVVTVLGNGSIVIVVATGDLTLHDGTASNDNTAVSAHGTGNVLLQTLAGSIFGDEDVKSGTGHISVVAFGSLEFTANADITTGGAGTVDLQATTGSITLSATSNVTAVSGNIRLYAGVDVALGGLISTGANVSVIANTGSITDADNGSGVDIAADSLRLQADDGIGSGVNPVETTVATITAHAGADGIFLFETDAVTVGTVAVAVNRVVDTAGVVTVPAVVDTQSGLVTAEGPIIFGNGTGVVTVNTALTVTGAGNIRLSSDSGSLVLNADVSSSAGHITIAAGQGIALGGGVDVTTGTPGTINLQANGGSLTMAGDSTVATTGSATVRLYASADVVLSNVTAAAVAVIANAGSITNAAGSVKNVTAVSLLMAAGKNVGVAGRHITTSVGNLSVNATGSGSESGIYISEGNGATVTGVSVQVMEVLAGNVVITPAADVSSDLTSGSNGDIILVSKNGGVTLSDGSDSDGVAVSANGSGKVLISGDDGSLIISADVRSTSGHITLITTGSISLWAGADVITAGTVNVEALDGSLLMNGESSIEATGSSVRLYALTVVALGNVTGGNVAVIAETGSIINAALSTKNVTAINLHIEADDAVGAYNRHLTTNVVNLTVAAAGNSSTDNGIYITEDNDAVVTAVAVTVQSVTSTAGLSQIEVTAQSDLTAGANGNIVLVAYGLVTLNDGSDADGVAVRADGSGNILIDAGSGALTVNSDISSSTGNITLAAQAVLTLSANVDVTTAAASIVFNGSSITMAASAKVDAGSGNVRMAAGVNIQVGGIVAQNVSLIATTGNITDGGDVYVNVVSSSLMATAGGGIGLSNAELEITVATISLVAGSGGVNLVETDNLTIGSVTVAYNMVQSGGSVVPGTDGAQSDIVSSGNVAITTVNGTITLTDGSDTDGVALITTGAANILLKAQGSASNLVLNSDVRSGSGDITLSGSVNATFAAGADITTGGGVISVEAVMGSVMMADSASMVSGGGNIRVTAMNNVMIGLLDGRTGGAQTTWANVFVQAATGGISDAGSSGSTTVRIYGQGVSLQAARNIGGINEPTFRLQYTTDFVTWTDVVTMTTGDATVTYVDPTPAESRRFYRIAYSTPGLTVTMRQPQVLADRSVRLTWDVVPGVAYVPVTKALAIDAAVLAAESGAGSVAVNDVNAVTVGDVTVSYRKVQASGLQGTTLNDGTKSDVRTSLGNGGIYLRALNGSLTITDGSMGAGAGISASGSGKVYLSGNSVQISANVMTGSGHVTVVGSASVNMNVGTQISTVGGDVTISSASGSVTVAVINTFGGDIALASSGLTTISAIDAATGKVSVIALGGIADGTDTGVNITAAAVVLNGGSAIGSLNDEFVLDTDLLAVTTNGVVRIANTGNLTVGSVSVSTAVVAMNGTASEQTAQTLTGMLSTASMILVNAGDLTVNGGITVTSGHLLLSATGAVTANSTIALAGGSLSVISGAGVEVNANVSVMSGTAELIAQGGDVSMAASAQLLANGGNARVVASGAVKLGIVDTRNGGAQSTWGDVSVFAQGGSITDADAGAAVNIYARNIRLSTAGNAGDLVPNAADGIEIDAAAIAVSAGGSVNIVASGTLAVDTISAVNVNTVGVEGLPTVSGDAGPLSGISGATGIVIRTLAGSLTITTAVNNTGAGNVLLSSAGGNAVVAANVMVANGSLSILSSASLTVNAGIMLSVVGGTADIAATGGSVTLNGVLQTVAANIRISASGSVTFNQVDARSTADRGGNILAGQAAWGDVSIVSASGSITEAGTDAGPDIYARNLRMVSAVAIGVSGGNAVETEVVLIAMATGTGGINVIDATNVAVGTVGTVPVGRVQFGGGLVTVADATSLTGVVKTGGILLLDAANGSNIPGFPQFSVVSTLSSGSISNPLTGLFEQRLQITNTTGSTIDAVRVAVGNLPSGVTLPHAAGTLIDGRSYVMFNVTLAANQTAELVVEFRVPAGSQIPTAATFEVDVTPVQTPPSVSGGSQLLTGVQVQRLDDKDYLLQINTLLGRTYYVQYSDDNINWTTMLFSIIGTGSTVALLDQGPPNTYPEPASISLRNYRVFLMP